MIGSLACAVFLSASGLALSPVDGQTGHAPVTLTFPEVLQDGSTTLTLSAVGPEPWPLHVLGTPPVYYELATGAVVQASAGNPITLCIDYSDVSFMDEDRLTLVQRWEDGWADRTALRDPEHDRVCGNAPSLGVFAIFEPENQPPRADAGPDQTVIVGDAYGGWVTLNGAATYDPDAEPLEIEWRDETGQLVASAVRATRDLALGHHELTLWARDPRGAVASDTVAIDVLSVPPEIPPVARATITGEGPAGTDLELDGSASFDPDGEVVSYAWDLGDGAAATGIATTHAYATAGSYTVILTATDDDGLSGTTSATVQVVAPNRPPSVSVAGGGECHPRVGLPCTVTLTADASDPDGDPLAYTWSGCASGSGPSAECVVPDMATYSATATVSDGRGGAASASGSATGINHAPIKVPGQLGTIYCGGGDGRLLYTDPDGDDIKTGRCGAGQVIGDGCSASITCQGGPTGTINIGFRGPTSPGSHSCGVKYTWADDEWGLGSSWVKDSYSWSYTCE